MLIPIPHAIQFSNYSTSYCNNHRSRLVDKLDSCSYCNNYRSWLVDKLDYWAARESDL